MSFKKIKQLMNSLRYQAKKSQSVDYKDVLKLMKQMTLFFNAHDELKEILAFEAELIPQGREHLDCDMEGFLEGLIEKKNSQIKKLEAHVRHLESECRENETVMERTLAMM